MNDGFRFSVCMSVYKNDNPQYLKEALNSVINQTRIPDEIIIVVDGPVDNDIKEVLEQYSNHFPAIRVLYQKENKGLGVALSIGSEACTYEWIARMDSDDISLPDRFEKQIDYILNHPEVDVLGGHITEFEGTPKNIIDKRVVPISNEDIYKFMKLRDGVNHMTVFLRKKKLVQAGGYQDCHFNEDTHLWIRMMGMNAVFANLDTVLVNVRVDNGMYERRGGFTYLKSDLNIQKMRLQYHQISFFKYILNCIIKTVVILMPVAMRTWVYKKILRKK